MDTLQTGEITIQKIEINRVLSDEQAQPRAQISEETINEYRQDMLTGAEFPPITVFYDGRDYWLADGFHRLLAAQDLGKNYIKAEIRPGDIRQAILFSVGANASHGLRRTNEDKRRAVMKLLEDSEWVQWSDKKIAEIANVSREYVNRLRNETDLTCDRSQVRYENKHGTITTMNTEKIGTANGSNGHTAVPKELYTPSLWSADGDSSDPEPYEPDNWQPPASKPHVSNNSGNNEWYTPAEFIEAARLVMGNIDLDPASSTLANETVKADFIYTIETNGLESVWWGNVWLNPPYAADLIPRFCEKLITSYVSGEVETAVVLVNNATETAWFSLLASCASYICFPKTRVKFWGPNGQVGSPLQGQAVLYFGGDGEKFTDRFSPLGFCVEVIHGN